MRNELEEKKENDASDEKGEMNRRWQRCERGEGGI